MSARVHLLVADPDLADGIPAPDLPLARRTLVAPTALVQPGLWQPETLCARSDVLLVLRGVIGRDIWLAGRRCCELFGPGDILRPAWDATDSLLPHDVTWSPMEPAAVAVLDERFRAATQRWPALAATVSERLLAQGDRVAMHAAISQLGRVDQRLLALFWHLADRWGRVTPDGVAVPLALTHEALGRLVGAQRPTITLALAELSEAGALRRDKPGAWVLDRGSRRLLEPDGARRVRPAPAPVVPVELAG